MCYNIQVIGFQVKERHVQEARTQKRGQHGRVVGNTCTTVAERLHRRPLHAHGPSAHDRARPGRRRGHRASAGEDPNRRPLHTKAPAHGHAGVRQDRLRDGAPARLSPYLGPWQATSTRSRPLEQAPLTHVQAHAHQKRSSPKRFNPSRA